MFWFQTGVGLRSGIETTDWLLLHTNSPTDSKSLSSREYAIHVTAWWWNVKICKWTTNQWTMAEDTFPPIPGLISYPGMIGRWGQLSHAENNSCTKWQFPTLLHFPEDTLHILISQGVESNAGLALASTRPSCWTVKVDTSSKWPAQHRHIHTHTHTDTHLHRLRCT